MPMDIDLSLVEQGLPMQQVETDGESASVSNPSGKDEPMDVDGATAEVKEPEVEPKPSTSNSYDFHKSIIYSL